MPRATRVHTIRRHLIQGGLIDIGLDEAAQKAGCPADHETDGFSVRQTSDAAGTLIVIAAAFGPDWFATMRAIRFRLEQPYVKCHVTGDAPGLADNELLVRWATSAELQARKRAQAQAQAPLVRQFRHQEAQRRAEEKRQALEVAGQSGLF
ncbi:hypothetical protein [Streptomyces sp. NPDC046976]|uniref:hypothetical protein n=1 Tax=Streptomyces sp. NPDC046976 TaxID=3155258 RepID=UPI0033E2B721